ncbi:hypothetical protein N473_26375 [Pseudoalteromonas luteoviolacea CPMOR-1]|uniref:Uncharacterized protein n=1 Tax=Pseudoalteromonas luteoviolacea CPMOR-1 TaxID=1365248 RepID=A0A167HU32_9GAMM|nr:hypothetical protein [Pseudoalteromonas luteoviolacea]KZN58530.1 hypothetical protein N473_26375 [Pseudoalteromonas luteoviolacea CPMOR-1]
MSNKIEQLTAEVTELSLQLQREIEPEKTEAKLKQQVEALTAELAAKSEENNTKVDQHKPENAKVFSERNGLLILQVDKSNDDTSFTVAPGVNILTSEQAQIALKYDQVKHYEPA